MRGVVVKSTGSWYSVRMEDGEIWSCRIKGKFRTKGIKTTNPVAVGDRVAVERQAGEGVIYDILDRKNYIIRKSTNLSRQAHIIAANVDQAILVTTLKHPEVSTVFIDRFLVSVEAYNIPAVLIFNKIDLCDEEDRWLLRALVDVYRNVGYTCLAVSAETGEGVEEVKQLLQDKVSVFSGQSGVGKSSLINRIEPELTLKTAKISEMHDTGKHTTTFAEMFELSFGGYIVDTPGIRAFGLVHMEKNEISHYFPEIFKYAEDCRYYNCTHIHEPGCAVLEAVKEGKISETRYFSYVSMFEEETEKYRKG
ncbi:MULTISPECIES: ribosome small subunit-dependent GTPase A [Sanguibacteroides]|uniref:Small ribosomal subunit biogenesis GTPase RsgA n=1 Tax=Sanguibacteroides justesenii TaxID=1547597 RepID=A0A0C3R4L4_9PORP|nr:MULTISPECIES: ribosome small subunit-dependent GTPase A [Sanguibacteroides]KIO44390.1 GTPase RsgA [Sanguibacteroides justesenii]KIO45352.1 GTPase RsgA [Sanguibacteroides justesenii]PXZ44640.1 ribosome small subunit-dependent GTPase A [Sanguibacteroides justesenii]